jgi:hypothetical protein
MGRWRSAVRNTSNEFSSRPRLKAPLLDHLDGHSVNPCFPATGRLVAMSSKDEIVCAKTEGDRQIG